MSGNFTQRAAQPVEKFARAEMAVRCGADGGRAAHSWAMATAEKFADGGVSLLAQCGVKPSISAGSECGGRRCPVGHGGGTAAGGCSPGYPAGNGRRAPLRRRPTGSAGARNRARRAPGSAQQHPGRGISQGHPPTGPYRRCSYGAPEDGGHHGLPRPPIFGRAGSGPRGEGLRPDAPQAADILGREMKKGLAPADPARLERAMLARLRLMNEHDFASLRQWRRGAVPTGVSGRTGGRQPGGYSDPGHHQRYPTARVRRMLWAVFLGLRRPERTSPMSEFWPPQRRGEGSCDRCGTQVCRY